MKVILFGSKKLRTDFWFIIKFDKRTLVMKDISVMREHIKEMIDDADDTTVEKVFRFLEDEYDDEDPLENLTPEEEESLLKSMAQADRGETTPHEEVMKKYAKWLSK